MRATSVVSHGVYSLVFMTTRRPGDILTCLLWRDNHFGDFRAFSTKGRLHVRVVCAVKNENRAVFLVS